MIVLLITFVLGLPSILTVIRREPDGFFRCPNDPITLKYGDPEDKFCVHYFLCHRGHAFPMACPVRSVFHPKIGECMPRTEVPEEICPFEIKCGFNGFYRDTKDCTKYFICFYQQPVHFQCKYEHVFEPAKSLCVKNKGRAAECSKPRPLPQFSTKPPTTTRKTTVKHKAATTQKVIQKRAQPEDIPEAYGEQRVMTL